MGLTIKKSEANGEEKRVIITLAGVATIGEVEKIKEVLISALVDCAELQLDVGEIIATDPALLQLIHAARCTAESAGKKFILARKVSAAFHETAISAGFLP